MGQWQESLMWCPSQLQLPISYDNQNYVIYLRWRHQDPWQASLVETGSDFEIKEPANWIDLKIDHFRDEEYPKLKIYIVNFVKKFLYSGQLALTK